MKRRTFLGGAVAVAVLGQRSKALAQQPPIKIGMSMPQTGGLADVRCQSPGEGRVRTPLSVPRARATGGASDRPSPGE